MTKKPNIKKNMQLMLATFVVLFALLGVYLMYSTVAYGSQWFAAPYNPRISAAKNVANAGSIYDRNGVPLAWSEGSTRRYAENGDMRRAVSHVVGDVYGKSMGAETYFAKYLYGYGQGVADRFSAAADGSKKGGDVTLTIDAKLCEYIYNNMDYNGAVVLLNYRTGEVLASVSVPTFDPEAIPDADPAEEAGSSKYLDRATQGRYPPGSTMKVVTTAAAIDNGLTDMELDCTGSDVVDGQRITCPKEGGHGHVDLTSAFEKSCNVYYANLSVELGETAMKRAAEQYLFNYEFSFPDFNMLKSNYSVPGNDGDLAWAGIGQYKDLVTPMHNALISAGVANGGTIMQPNTLLDVSYGGHSAYNYKAAAFKTVASPGTAAQLTELMRGTVDHGTATSADIGAAPICGKTGTAEYVEDGQVKNHSWFVGFSQDPNHPLAIAVILEGAGFGSAHATPLAGQVFGKAIDLGY